MDVKENKEIGKVETAVIKETGKVETAVVKVRCPVTYYNKFAKIIVYVRDGQEIQTFCDHYDGSGFIEVE